MDNIIFGYFCACIYEGANSNAILELECIGLYSKNFSVLYLDDYMKIEPFEPLKKSMDEK